MNNPQQAKNGNSFTAVIFSRCSRVPAEDYQKMTEEMLTLARQQESFIAFNSPSYHPHARQA